MGAHNEEIRIAKIRVMPIILKFLWNAAIIIFLGALFIAYGLPYAERKVRNGGEISSGLITINVDKGQSQ